jgi:general stress protein 26
MADDHMQEFVEILESFDHAMLVTQRDSELRSRPMAIADRTRDGRVWFITSVDSAKLQEITDYPDVNVAMQSGSTFLSISGTVRATRDPDKINELWNDVQELWFPEGRNDPTLILLEVVPTYAEYWDRSGVEAVKFMFDAAKSMATGRTLSDDEGKHAKLRFPDTAA